MYICVCRLFNIYTYIYVYYLNKEPGSEMLNNLHQFCNAMNGNYHFHEFLDQRLISASACLTVQLEKAVLNQSYNISHQHLAYFWDPGAGMEI